MSTLLTPEPHAGASRVAYQDASTVTPPAAAGGALSSSQMHAILVAAVSCASFSLVAALVTLRWFVVMKRSFRHRLVLHLVISDTFKAFWYFLFPIVVFVHGPVQVDSSFCQASGFLLLFAIQASDLSILIIALHSILYILKPNAGVGEGGLYPYRHWIYPAWLLPPLLSASLAFINDQKAYVTAGTFCFLPKRPIWYRLALQWVPRYLIIALILIMYIWIYVYVHIKFRGFDSLGETVSSDGSPWPSRRRSTLVTEVGDAEQKDPGSLGESTQWPVLRAPSWNPQSPNPSNQELLSTSQQLQPWDQMNFITSKPLQKASPGVATDDGGSNTGASGSGWSSDTPVASSSRSQSQQTSDTAAAQSNQVKKIDEVSSSRPAGPSNVPVESNDPLLKTRIAIRKQLRYLFVYPLLYIISWTFPFVWQVYMFNSYYVQHPIFWLSIVQTIMLALQAGMDCIVFSWTEKPWRRIDPTSKFSLTALQRWSKTVLHRHCPDDSTPPATEPAETEPPPKKSNPHWWEAEGHRRKDSVWLGTSTIFENLSPVTTRGRSRSPDKPSRDSISTRRTSADHPLGALDGRSMSSSHFNRGGKIPRRISSNFSGRESRRSIQSMRAPSQAVLDEVNGDAEGHDDKK